MVQTNFMRADEIAHGFNGVTERTYWRASVGGSRINAEVHFNSRASMVQVAYHVVGGHFTITFNKANTAFGDFLASTYRSMDQILVSLKAAGLPFLAIPHEAAVLRIEYDPRTKQAAVHLAGFADTWADVEPLPLKTPQRNNLLPPIDAI